MKRSSVMLALPVFAVATLVAAQTATTHEGGPDYQAFCAPCHGSTGRGDGVVAASLKRRPSDLTQLAKKNDGIFPAERVSKTIDGGAVTHGGSTGMPEWASVFAKSRESGSAAEVKTRIDALVKYLEGIQAKS